MSMLLAKKKIMAESGSSERAVGLFNGEFGD